MGEHAATAAPATQHTRGQAEHSATWTGIGGGCVTDNCQVTDDTLIQVGAEQDATKAGTASYGAWWEIIPEPQTKVALPVSPGNKIKGVIAQTSIPGTWSIVIATPSAPGPARSSFNDCIWKTACAAP